MVAANSWGALESLHGSNATVGSGALSNVQDSMAGNTPLKCVDEDVSKLCQEGQIQEALQILDITAKQGIWASIKLQACLLKGCIKFNALAQGKLAHAYIVEIGFESNILLANTLVDMYAKCGSLPDASEIFNRIPSHNIFSWTALISAYAKYGDSERATDSLQQMQTTGVFADKFVLILVLKACTSITALKHGMHVHAHIVNTELESDLFVESALVDMYAKCKSIDHARQVFDKMKERDVVSWTTIIAGYAQQGCSEEALMLFKQMQHEGVEPNRVTFLAVLKACSSPTALEEGKHAHSHILKNGLESDVLLGNTLIDMYSNCCSIEDARHVFDGILGRDVVSWNAMIAGYAQWGLGAAALILFEEMKKEHIDADHITFVGVLKACAYLAALEQSKLVHAQIIIGAFESDVFIQSSLVDIYAKCGSIKDAWHVFDNMHELDVVSWTAIIAGYANSGHGKEALSLFEQMRRECLKPDDVAFINALKACACLGALQQGKQMHADIMKSSFHSTLFVGNTLVDMYAKCGSLMDAHEVFRNMQVRDVISWNTIISGYALLGFGKQAIKLFEQMLHEGKEPDEATFLFVLTACRHAGLVDEGRHYYDSLIRDHGVTPTVDHCACMVDLLGRVGRLDEAEDFICKMQIDADAVVWMVLLGACRSHGNVELGKRSFEHVHKLEPKISGAYVLLSNLFAMAGRWEDVAKIRNEMDNIGVKVAGDSWIELADRVHTFSASDRSQP